MKQVVVCVLLGFLSFSAFNQVVNSACHAPDSVVAMYYNDAQQLALRKVYDENMSWKDSLQISPAYTDTFLRALLAVYNANLPARDSVVSFGLHTFPKRQMRGIRFRADTALAWVLPVKNHQFPTGDTLMDSLMTFYHMQPKGGFTFPYWSYYLLNLLSDSNYNSRMFSSVFDSVPGVSITEAAIAYGDGNDITAVRFPGFIQLTYKLANGDCPAGCIYRHYWVFRVYDDCSVEFVNSYGSPIFPSYVPPADINVCAGDTVELTLQNCIGCVQVDWMSLSDSVTYYSMPKKVIVPADTTTYLVTVTSGFGIKSTTQFTINVTPMPQAAFTITVASGNCPVEVYFTDSSLAGYTYRQWTIDTGMAPSLVALDINVGPVEYHSPGTYQVKLIVSNACGTDTEVQFMDVNCTEEPDTVNTGIANSPNLHFSLFPNPATHNIEVHISHELVGSTLLIYNIAGKLMEKVCMKQEVSTIDVWRLPPGIYYVKILSEKLQVVPVKFLRN